MLKDIIIIALFVIPSTLLMVYDIHLNNEQTYLTTISFFVFVIGIFSPIIRRKLAKLFKK